MCALYVHRNIMIDVYTIEQIVEWNRVVNTFSKCDVYYYSEYVKGFKIHGDGEPLLIHYYDSNISAINVVMKRDISDDIKIGKLIEKNRYYDLSTPYGYGGWIIDGEGDLETLFVEYTNWCKENNIISEFVRFHPVLRNHNYCLSSYDVVKLGKVVTMDLTSKDIIWNNIISKNRNMIRKAEKNGIRILVGDSKELYETFKVIYDETMKHDNADEYYYFKNEFYESIRCDLCDKSKIFYAVNDENKIISAAIILMSNGKLNYHLSGSVYEYRKYAPTNLLLYSVAAWGSEHRYNTLYLGGGVGAKEDALLAFKKSFYKGELDDYFIGKKIFDEEKYFELCRMRKKDQESKYFPLYRA